SEALSPLYQLAGSFFISQIHTEITRNMLNLKPDAAIGFSSTFEEALIGQAQEINFSKLINKAWNDGARVFIEHGPRDTLTTVVKKTLSGKPYLALSLDKP